MAVYGEAAEAVLVCLTAEGSLSHTQVEPLGYEDELTAPLVSELQVQQNVFRVDNAPAAALAEIEEFSSCRGSGSGGGSESANRSRGEVESDDDDSEREEQDDSEE